MSDRQTLEREQAAPPAEADEFSALLKGAFRPRDNEHEQQIRSAVEVLVPKPRRVCSVSARPFSTSLASMPSLMSSEAIVPGISSPPPDAAEGRHRGVDPRSQVVLLRREHKRCTAAPATHHLRRDEFLLLARVAIRAEELSEPPHMLLQSPVRHEAAVAREDLRLRQV